MGATDFIPALSVGRAGVLRSLSGVVLLVAFIAHYRFAVAFLVVKLAGNVHCEGIFAVSSAGSATHTGADSTAGGLPPASPPGEKQNPFAQSALRRAICGAARGTGAYRQMRTDGADLG